MFKLLMLGIVLGVGAYYYDMNTAPKKVRDATYSSSETDIRCRNNHESMCKYYITVKIESEKLFYKYRVPSSIYRSAASEEGKQARYRVMYKEKKIFPAAIVGLEPKMQAAIDKSIAEEK